jgi:HipA-like protein
MNGDFVGTWRQDAGGVDLLAYDAGWQSTPHGRPLSLSLPFTPGGMPHRGEMVRAYFENLLPDSQEIRARAARRGSFAVHGRRDARGRRRLPDLHRRCTGEDRAGLLRALQCALPYLTTGLACCDGVTPD